MKSSIFVSLIFVLTIGCFSKKDNPNIDFDFDAAKAYFDITTNLQNGKILTQNEWNTFFDIPGNKHFIKENGIPKSVVEQFQKSMEVVYMPSKDSLFQELKESDYDVQTQSRYKENYQTLKDYVNWLDENRDFLTTEMVALTRTMLPKRMHQLDTFPNIYFHTLGEPSANEKGLFLDLLVEFDCNQELFSSMAAHELHHFMRATIMDKIKPSKNDKGIIYALEASLNEGIADLVDKEVLLSEKSNWWMKEPFQPIIDASPQVIKNLDQLIIDESRGKHHKEKKYRKTLMNTVGHIPGYYMAKKIKQYNYELELIEHADDPFMFFQLYQKAAQKANDDTPLFSSESMSYIKKLKGKYLLNHSEKEHNHISFQGHEN